MISGFSGQLAGTVFWQGSGAAATVLAATWIGATLGPQQQGLFNATKSLVELGAALAMLGMPQALYVFAQQRRIGVAAAHALSRRLAWLGVPVGAALVWTAQEPTWELAGLLAAAVALASLHGQWRTLVLLGAAGGVFGVVTAAPQWAMLALAGVVVAAGGVGPATLAAGVAMTWALGCLVAARALRPLIAPEAASVPGESGLARVPMGALARHGAATWIATSLAAGSVVLLQQWAAWRGGGDDLGRVSLALMLAQVPLTPLNYMLPLLLRRRLRQGCVALGSWRVLAMAAAPMLVLALPVASAGAWWRTDLGLGAGYGSMHRLLAAMLVAGAAEAVLRLLSVEAQAAGRPQRLAAAETLRLAVFAVAAVAMTGLAAGPTDVAEALASAWAVAALAAAALLVAATRLGRR